MVENAAFIAQLKDHSMHIMMHPTDHDDLVCLELGQFAYESLGGPFQRRAICGRSSSSSDAIDMGKIIFRNDPYGWVLHSDYVDSHCSNCCKSFVAEELKQCSRCHFARYCSRECQLHDYQNGGHAIECKHLPQLPRSSSVNELRLLLRMFYTTYLKKKAKHYECTSHNESTITCGIKHLKCMSTAAGIPELCDEYDGTQTQENVVRTITLAAHILNQEDKPIHFPNIISLLASFRTNNFGIQDELFNVIGSGAFPATALLNHSCSPTVVLTYLPSPTGPTVCGIALQSLLPGRTELTHSYVDMCYPVRMRREQLHLTHKFHCNCTRCLEQLTVYRSDFTPWTAEEDAICERLEGLCRRPLEMRRALEALSTATTRPHAVVERLLTGTGPLCQTSYKSTCRAFETCLYGGQTDSAVALCEEIVSCMAVYFCQVSFHPLLGLQLFTLGDLCSAIDQPGRAGEYYSWCRQVLQFTHSRALGSDLLDRLDVAERG